MGFDLTQPKPYELESYTTIMQVGAGEVGWIGLRGFESQPCHLEQHSSNVRILVLQVAEARKPAVSDLSRIVAPARGLAKVTARRKLFDEAARRVPTLFVEGLIGANVQCVIVLK